MRRRGWGRPSEEGNASRAVITHGTFEVEYAADAVVVPESVAARIERIESDRLVFDGDIRQVRELPTGKPVLFEGKTLRKITEVREEGGKLVALTEPATLNELIEEGTVAWTHDFRWDTVFAADTGSGKSGIEAWFFDQALAQEGGEIGTFKGEVAGWEVSISLRPEGGGERLNLELTAEKANAATIRATGYLSRFTAEASVAFADGELQTFSYVERGVEGQLEVQFAGVGLGSEVALARHPLRAALPLPGRPDSPRGKGGGEAPRRPGERSGDVEPGPPPRATGRTGASALARRAECGALANPVSIGKGSSARL